MLHVLILILKIIGVVLLGIIGLLLALVTLVLFVPIRYRMEGSYYEKPEGAARITWLLHMLSVQASYQEDFRIVIRVLGFKLPSGSEDEKELVTAQSTDAENEYVPPEEVQEQLMEEVQEQSPEDAPEQQLVGDAPEQPAGDTPEQPVGDGRTETASHKTIEDSVQKAPAAEAHRTVLEKIKFLFQAICARLKNISRNLENIKAFIQNTENQATFHLIVRQVKGLFKHILPRKASGKLTFGFDDPYTTGQVLSAAGILYPWYGGRIQITPVFDAQVLEGELQLKGRIRLGTILFLGLRILMNKNFRVLLKRWRSEGGVLDGRE